MNLKPVMLAGRHIRLEPMTEAHAAGLAEIGCDPRIWRYMLYGDIRTRADMLAWVRDILARGSDMPFVVVHLASGRSAGATRFMDLHPEHRGLEIGGTWYGPEFQRTAVNTETKYLLLRHAFETLEAIRVQFKTDLRNERSQSALERIGAIREGVLRNHMILPDGAVRDSVYYSILDREWPGVKAGLEKMLAR
jgi:RimJ/RimL family protein N-acetyltransferase